MHVSAADLVRSRLLLASVEAELGDLAEAARLSSDVCASLTRTEGMLAAEAFWVAATVNTRQGHCVQAAELLQHALVVLDSQEDLTLWMRLRMAAASLALQAMPPRTPRPTSGPSYPPSGWPGPPAPPRVPLPQHPTRLPAGRPGCRRHAPRTGRGRRPPALLPGPEPSPGATGKLDARAGIPDALTRLRDLATSVQQLSMPDLAAEVGRAVADRTRLAA